MKFVFVLIVFTPLHVNSWSNGTTEQYHLSYLHLYHRMDNTLWSENLGQFRRTEDLSVSECVDLCTSLDYFYDELFAPSGMNRYMMTTLLATVRDLKYRYQNPDTLKGCSAVKEITALHLRRSGDHQVILV